MNEDSVRFSVGGEGRRRDCPGHVTYTGDGQIRAVIALTTTMATPLFFSTFEVTRQAFHRTALAYAIVNLKPIVPGRTCPALFVLSPLYQSLYGQQSTAVQACNMLTVLLS